MRLATFNILHGRSLVDGRVNLGRYATAMATLGADVVALQEVDLDQARSHGADLTAVAAEALGTNEHRFVATLSGAPELWTAATGDLQPATSHYGIALLSRYPVSAWRTLKLPALPGRVPLLFPGRRRPVMVGDEPRAALAATVELPDGPVTIVSTHLTFIPGWNAVQLRRLVRALRDSARPALLMGDLNLHGNRPADVTGWTSLGAAATYPVASPRRQLDHVLADGFRGAGGRVRAVEAVDLGLSDHRALVVDVDLLGA